ncbi:hypothetical protein ACVIIV_003137 [Bradyrhizobium sp. USDA 4354]
MGARRAHRANQRLSSLSRAIFGRSRRATRPLRRGCLVAVAYPAYASLDALVVFSADAWIVILGDRGLINNLLLELGVISSPQPLIYNRMAVYIGMVHIMLPLMTLPLVSVLLGIDKSLARSMGARPFMAFWRVFLPLSMPGVRSGSLPVFRTLPWILYHAGSSRRPARRDAVNLHRGTGRELLQHGAHRRIGLRPSRHRRGHAPPSRARFFRYAGPRGATRAEVLAEPAALAPILHTLFQ